MRFRIYSASSLLLAGLVFTSARTFAQQDVTVRSQAFENARAFFASKDYQRGEAALLASNRSKAGTARWNVESGAALVRVAFMFQNNGDGQTAVEAARRSAQYLTQAIRKLDSQSQAAELASAHELLGQVYEQLLGDAVAAETEYTAAVVLAPDHGQAQSLLRKLQASRANDEGRNHK